MAVVAATAQIAVTRAMVVHSLETTILRSKPVHIASSIVCCPRAALHPGRSPKMKYKIRNLQLKNFIAHLLVSTYSIFAALLITHLYQEWFYSASIQSGPAANFIIAWFDRWIVIPTTLYLTLLCFVSRCSFNFKLFILISIGAVYGYIGGFLVQDYWGPFCVRDCFSGIFMPYSFMYNSGAVFGTSVTIIYVFSFLYGNKDY